MFANIDKVLYGYYPVEAIFPQTGSGSINAGNNQIDALPLFVVRSKRQSAL
jgi:hypothetical protein